MTIFIFSSRGFAVSGPPETPRVQEIIAKHKEQIRQP
jgi:hypothetical protein